jgi:hypothetical protein
MSFIHKITKYGGKILVALCLAVQTFTVVHAANLEGANSTSNKLTFGGDLRLRHESFYNKTQLQPDRHRQRMRLRFGVKAEMEKWEANLRLASGTGEQTSTNQTFTNGFNQKGVYIDQAFGTYKPWDWLKVHGGKMNNPFWRVYSGDLIWDGDVNPEGLAEQLSYDIGNLTVFGNFGQMPMFENSSSYKDPYLIGNQIGIQTKFGEGIRWNFAVASYHPTYEESSVLLSTVTISNDPSMDQPVVQGDNRRIATANGAQLVGGYHMLNFTTELGFQLGLPVRLQADFVRNVAGNRVNNQNTGYQAGFILNSAKTAGTWEFGYFNKFVEANATLADLADSDWGNGGTNRKGHIIWLAYCPVDFLTLQGKYFMTRRADPTIGVNAPYAANQAVTYRDINRFQLDAVIKF